MSLTLSINNALTGLNVNQQALSVLSQNIANANTPGYSRQIINQQAVTLDGVGEGVSIESITRKVDDYLTKAVQAQHSEVGIANVISDYHAKIQLLLGSPGGQDSIDSYINGYFNALQSLSQTPDNTTIQRIAVNNGVTLATKVHELADALHGLQFQADIDIAAGVNAINNDLRTLYDLNKLISQNKALGKMVADLEDRRDVVIQEIAQYIDVNTFEKADGSYFLTTAGGISILDDSLYQLSYTQVSSQAAFSTDATIGALTVVPVDEDGNIIGNTQTLTTEGTSSEITSLLTSGKIAGLYELRDEIIPNILSQLNTMASGLRDQVNAIQNAGSGYPGANSFTGTRLVFGQDYSQWTGSVRIAVLDATGNPIPAAYPDEPNGMPPLTLDLSTLDSGNGAGNPSVQGIIDAINQYYGVPQNKATVGNLNNIQLVSDSTALPNSSALFNFDFSLDNISGSDADFFVTGLQVKDNLGADITSITNNVPSVDLDPAATYVTSPGNNEVVVNTTTAHNFADGDTVYLSLPSGAVDGIPASDLSGYFTISNVTSTSFTITAATAATAGGTFAEAAMTVTPPYGEAGPGERVRTSGNGLITADLSGNTTAVYYDITATVAVLDDEGNLSTSQITYRVNNQQPSMLGRYFGAQAVANGGELVTPSAIRPIVTAKLVDANGNELPKVNGQYTSEQSGYLKLQAGTSSYVLAIDSLDSKEMGRTNVSPAVPGTNRGFSHYFDLNDFFKSNVPTNTGDTIAGSALALEVEGRIRNNPGLISLGQMIRSSDSVNPNLPPNFTYHLNPSDNSVVTRLAQLGSQTLNFAAAGGLGATTQTLTGYTAQIVGSVSVNAADSTIRSGNADTLLQGYALRASAISGVNLDVELANTVIYQNAYAASARVITVANTLFEALLQAF
jgi:flagellar hook-associated protein FlgK